VMQAASSPFSSSHPRRRSRGAAATCTSPALLDPGDADAVRTAVWHRHLHLVPHAAPQQRAADGRLVAHPARLGVRLGGPNYPVALLGTLVLDKAHGAPQTHLVIADRRVDDHVVLHD